MVEEARLESVCTPKGYHEFESHPLRFNQKQPCERFFRKAVLFSTGCFLILHFLQRVSRKRFTYLYGNRLQARLYTLVQANQA